MASSLALAIIFCSTISYNSFVSACGAGPAGAAAGVAGAGGAGLHLGELGLAPGLVGGKCIYEEAEIRMADGGKRKVKNLQIGDQVLAYSLNKGIHPSRIFGELHNDNETMVKIIEIETNTGRKIPVTPEHSLFVRQCLSDGQKWSPKTAQQISVGDCVPRYYMADGDVIEEAVTEIRVFEAKGIRQPVTETGTIIVDDIVVSCYDRVVNQDATHMALFPYRWISTLRQNYMAQIKSLLPSFFNMIGFMETSLI